ncbi:HIT family protein [Parabacteroides sp. PF5-6]|uniref:HIT family protein n=1 Tax=Parabacteroides sp. PF5-6 TaxID=1742403 RepID=UPI002407293C|nr:HIT family protein [Parabacteroides sp. PF5-6]MDF9831352.1 histidine triad (HIT) family protein [Parabacteroides sp. PF5-6]
MATLFSRIVAGEIPCHKIAENEEFFAFLDINPMAPGHTLVIPKEEVDYIFDIADDKLGRMMAFSKGIAAALSATIPSRKIALSVIGLEVPHAHIHLIPINREADIHPTKDKTKPDPEELAGLAAQIREHYK